ncbi:hypothetical protein MHBO_004045 [Bonamia ostreae]|uniref:SB domain-containing protein n=1 Tax=Bonamia ostreae TaxID=126728 RepID=A0ABV2AS94_9EUKA
MRFRQAKIAEKISRLELSVGTAKDFDGRLKNIEAHDFAENSDFLSKKLLRYISIDRSITDTLSVLRKIVDQGDFDVAVYMKNIGKIFKTQFKVRHAIISIIKMKSEQNK